MKVANYEAARLGVAGANWAAALEALPARQLEHPWPFPVSVTAEGLVRNAPPKGKKQAKGKKRMDWCRGWAMNASLVAAGQRPAGHCWPHDAYGQDTDRCMLCHRERGELWATGRTPPP